MQVDALTAALPSLLRSGSRAGDGAAAAGHTRAHAPQTAARYAGAHAHRSRAAPGAEGDARVPLRRQTARAAAAARGSPKRARFAPDTKSHDGVSTEAGVFEDAVVHFLRGEGVGFARAIGASPCPAHVIARCDDLITRLSLSESGTAPVLPSGGGRAAVLRKEHIASVVAMRQCVAGVAPGTAGAAAGVSGCRAQDGVASARSEVLNWSTDGGRIAVAV